MGVGAEYHIYTSRFGSGSPFSLTTWTVKVWGRAASGVEEAVWGDEELVLEEASSWEEASGREEASGSELDSMEGLPEEEDSGAEGESGPAQPERSSRRRIPAARKRHILFIAGHFPSSETVRYF